MRAEQAAAAVGVARPSTWISCVAVDDTEEWLVCGGGPQLSLWHLRSNTRTAVLDAGTPGFHPIAVEFTGEGVRAVGNDAMVRTWALDGSSYRRDPAERSCRRRARLSND